MKKRTLQFLEVDLPWPPAGLSPNGRLNYFAKARLSKKGRRDGFWAAKSALRRTAIQVPIHPVYGGVQVVFRATPPTRRIPDDDNFIARMKPYRDGVADALKVNDRCFHSSVRFLRPRRPGHVVMVLSWIPSAARKWKK